MAAASRPKAHLLRELNSTRHSSTSSRASNASGSSFSDFDPENEAIMSTRQIDDVARKLPELRASAQKYSKPRSPEPDYHFDTSIMRKAFPDFSQGSLAEQSSDPSIEIGRGLDTRSRSERLEFSSLGELDLDEDSLTFKGPSKNGRQNAQTSSRNQQQSPKSLQDNYGGRSQAYRASGLRNELGASPAAKAKDYGSGESRKSSSNGRRTLGAMHDKAKNEKDQSYLAEDRPPTIDLTIRSTRFNSNKPSVAQDAQLPNKFRASQGFQPKDASQRLKKGRGIASQLTQGSFQLPEMPNVSELVSGVFEDGTPVYSRHGKSRVGRSTTSQKLAADPKIGEVPVPIDEQAIFLSLKILEDRVGLLEREKAELEVTVKDLECKNSRLEMQNNKRMRRSDRSDSALGLADSESQDEGGQRGQAFEKDRLASTAKALRQQLSVAERKVSTTENIIRNVTQERDAAVSQLSVAYVTIEELKAENESWLAEKQELEQRVQHLSSAPASTSSARVDAIKKKVADMKEAQRKINFEAEKKSTASKQIPKVVIKVGDPKLSEEARIKQAEDDGYDELFDLTPRAHRVVQDALGQQIYGAKNGDAQKQPSIVASTKLPNNKNDDAVSESSADFTELSYIDTKDIENVRQALELERLNKNGLGTNADRENETQGSRFSANQPGEKSRTIDLRRSSTTAAILKQDALPMGNDNTTGHGRRHSESSVVATGTRRRGQTEKNMTSAFIIPDITIGQKKQVIPKPVPVSSRMQEAEPYEDAPTIRPSQSPGLALATVIKNFEDEIAGLKKVLTEYQAKYNGLDAAISRRRRKYIFEKMEATMKAIDAKSDQMYSLYDVLEGQKQSGQELTQEEVDVTLQSIGIEASDLGVGLFEDVTRSTKKSGINHHAWDLTSENEHEDELPWEGIETTIETTKTGSTHGHRRRGSRF